MKVMQMPRTIFLFVGGLFLACLALGFIFELLWLTALPFALLFGYLFLSDFRIPFYLLLASLPISFHFQDKLDFPDEILMIACTILFFLYVLIKHRSLVLKNWIQHPLIIIIAISFCWLILSVVFSESPLFSAKFLLKKIWYLIPFLMMPIVLLAQKEAVAKAFQILIVPMFLVTLIVLIRFSGVGFRFEEVHDPLQPFFINHVIYGSMVSCMVPLTVAAFALSRKLSVQWLFSLAGIILFVIASYLSYSRAAWMAIVFACMVYLFVRFKVMHYAILLFYGVVLSGILWLAHDNNYMRFTPEFEKTVMHESLADHIMATIQGTDISSAERYYRWIAGIRMSQDHPWFGVGPNNFYEHYKSYTVSAFRTWVSRNFERSTTHNYFLYMLVEQGYPAMIFYATLIFMVFFYGQKLYHRLEHKSEKIIVMSILCMIGGVFVNNFFSELLEIDKIGSLFYIGIGILVAISLKENLRQQNQILCKD